MPVHEIRYRAYDGPILPGPMRLAAIPVYSFRAVFTRYVAAILFGVGVLAVIGLTAYLYISNNPIVRQALGMTYFPEIGWRTLLARLLYIQVWPCVLVTILTAPKMLSPEIAHHALPIIYSRPITRTGYILGKVSASVGMLSFLTWVQVLLLSIAMLVFYPGTHEVFQSLLGTTLPTFFAAAICGLAIAITISLIGLACSSATKNKAFAGILFLAVYFGSTIFSKIAGQLFETDRLYFGLSDALYDLPGVFVQGDSGRSAFWVIAGIAVWCAASLMFLHWRLRPVEIHKG